MPQSYVRNILLEFGEAETSEDAAKAAQRTREPESKIFNSSNKAGCVAFGDGLSFVIAP
jgi:hypothetical protein